MDLVFKLFSRTRLDDDSAIETLTFLLEFDGGVFRPDECGVYEPFEPFEPSALVQYAGWLKNPGGEFAFRRSGPPFSLEGQISNLQFADSVPGPTVHPPIFVTRWSIYLGAAVLTFRGPEFLKALLIDACRLAKADYGFVATEHDYRSKHFVSIREGTSEVQQYVGDNPEQGVPGLYWMNFFGPMYVEHFGSARLAKAGGQTEMAAVEDEAVYLRFGRSPEDSGTAAAVEQQRMVMRSLGEHAFFDSRAPQRQLDIPAPLRRR